VIASAALEAVTPHLLRAVVPHLLSIETEGGTTAASINEEFAAPHG
jgi:hypothetical protein